MDTQETRKFIGVEYATEMDHMTQIQQGTKSTTMKSRHGQPAKLIKQSDRTEVIHDAISVPTQEPNNKNKIWFLCQYRDQKYSLQVTRPENFPGRQIDT